MFRPENDLGPAEVSLKLENISLIFKLTGSQQADLTALLAEQQDTSSPNYHQWLTPEQYADRFGLSANDLGQVVGWLQAQGFQINQTARSRNWVSFSGTAAQVQAAFLTEIHQFSVDGQIYYGNAAEPAVPAALADVVLGFHALDNYPLRPHGVVRRVKAEPDFTSSITGANFVAPGDFAVIYDVKNLYSAGINGSGQTIAVMGQTNLYNDGSGQGSDVVAFRAAAGLPANPPTLRLVPGVTNPGVVPADIDEASLDVEWAGAVAPNATILFVNGGSNGVFNALADTITNNLAPVITISYGGCENRWSPSSLNQYAQLAVQANMQGQTILSAVGDAGAADCDNSTSTSVVTSATHGLAVDAPGSLPYVTGVGGSEFNEGSGTYWQTASGSDVLTSALSYIPERAWNDTTSVLNTTHSLLAGGGGVSGFFAKPAWQTGVTPNDGFRDVPDVALSASPGHDGFLICTQGKCLNGFRFVSQDPTLNQTVTEVGGTSVAAPSFAGIVALINQQTSQRWGNINMVLYAMAQNVPTAFHDITTGDNKVPCTAGSTGCPNGGQIGYSAGVGYDQVTGLGSVDAFNLVINWNSPGAPDFSLSASPSSLTIAPGASATSTLTLNPVNGFSATPTFTCVASSALVGVTCAVGALSSDTATVTVTASSTATMYRPLPQSPHWGGWWIAAPLIGLLLIALFCIHPSWRQMKVWSLSCAGNADRPLVSGALSAGVLASSRRLRILLLGAVLLGLLLASLSCGGGSGGGGGTGVTTPPPESGTVTVTGTSNGTSHNVQITVSVR